MSALPLSGWLPGKNKSADQEKRPHVFFAVDLLLWVFCLSLLTDVNADHPMALKLITTAHDAVYVKVINKL